MTSMRENRVEAGGFVTRYLEAGNPDHTDVLLLHDGAWGGSSSVSWANIIPMLAEKYHVLAPDLLGFGGSDKAVYLDRAQYEPRIVQMRAFLAVLGVTKPIHVIGNSFGGSLALRMMASDDSHLLRSVVSICGTGGPWRSEISLAELGHWDGTEEDLRRVVELLIDNTTAAEGHIAERMRWATEIGHYRAVMATATPLPAALSYPRTADDWPRPLNRSRKPLMLVAGQRDVLLEQGWPTKIEEALPTARVEILDCKHAPNIDRPELLVPILLDFLGQS